MTTPLTSKGYDSRATPAEEPPRDGVVGRAVRARGDCIGDTKYRPLNARRLGFFISRFRFFLISGED